MSWLSEEYGRATGRELGSDVGAGAAVAAVAFGGPAAYSVLGGTGTAILGSAALGAYTAKESSEAISEASEEATQATLTANQENIAFQREVFGQQQEDTAPWRDAGVQALGQIQEGIAAGEFDPRNFNFEADPGYQFRLSEGVKARDASASARGRLLSGAQEKAITRYGQDYASGEYGAAYDRNMREQQQRYNVLAGMSQTGQVATGQGMEARNVMASRVGEGITGSGRAVAQNELTRGSARSSAYQGVAGAAQQGMQNYLLYSNLRQPQGLGVDQALDYGAM